MQTKRNEIGAVRKDWGGRTPVAIVYPNTYYVGMSNLAVHLFYKLLNDDPQIVAERIFLDTNGRSVESNRSLDEFAIALFSFSFEMDYLNLNQFVIPAKAGIPDVSEIPGQARDDRLITITGAPQDDKTITVAGGPAVTMNPEGLSDIFDVIVAGEGEEKIFEIVKRACHSEERSDEESPKRGGSFAIAQDDRLCKPIDLDKYPTHSVIWTNDTEFGHMHLVEVSRGCPWNCRFCATPPIYAPYRMRSKDVIMSSIEFGLSHRNHIGLIGSDVLGHPDFLDIAEDLVRRNIKISLSSLRVNRISKDVAELLARSGHKRATLGIEGGSEKMRKLIDKDLTEARIFKAVKNLANAGITNLKLYFMIGLPNETEEDIKAISEMTKEIRKILLSERSKRTLSPNISVVVTPFIPKKLTPFEDQPFAGVKYLNGALKKLRSAIGKIPNAKITGESPKNALMEYELSHKKFEIHIPPP